jgi:hypothetical protein
MPSAEESIIAAHLESLSEGVHAALVKVLRKNPLENSRGLYRLLVDKDRDFWIALGNKVEIQALLEKWTRIVQRLSETNAIENKNLLRTVWVTFVRRLTLNPALIFVEREGASTDGLALMQLFCAVCRHTVYTHFAFFAEGAPQERTRDRRASSFELKSDLSEESDSHNLPAADNNHAVTIRFNKPREKTC